MLSKVEAWLKFVMGVGWEMGLYLERPCKPVEVNIPTHMCTFRVHITSQTKSEMVR